MDENAFVMDFSEIQDLGPVPDGTYFAEVIKSTPDKAQSGYPKIALQWQIVEGEYEGRIVFDTLSWHPNALPFTKKKLLGLGFDENFKGSIDPEGLVGIERELTVAVKPSKNIDPETGQPYPPRNEIVSMGG